MAKTKTIKVLIIEDNPIDAKVLQKTLEHEQSISFSFTFEEQYLNGLSRLSIESYDLLFLDLIMSDSIGLDMIDRLKMINGKVPIIVYTSFDDPLLEKEALVKGAKGYLVKGKATHEEILNLVKQSLGSIS
mgnify:CR=1 FL=1